MVASGRDRVAYGLLLRLLPRGFRDRHGGEMVELFGEELGFSLTPPGRR